MQGKNFKIKIVELANGWKPKIIFKMGGGATCGKKDK